MNCMSGPFNVDDSDIETSVSSHLSYPASVHSHTGSHSDENNNDDSNNDRNGGELEQMKLFAAVETARVNRWKLFVIFTILVVGGAVSTFTFITLRNEQSNDAFNAVRLYKSKNYFAISNIPPTYFGLFLFWKCSFTCLPTRSRIHSLSV